MRRRLLPCCSLSHILACWKTSSSTVHSYDTTCQHKRQDNCCQLTNLPLELTNCKIELQKTAAHELWSNSFPTMGINTLAYLIAFTTCCHSEQWTVNSVWDWCVVWSSTKLLMDPEHLVTALGDQRKSDLVWIHWLSNPMEGRILLLIPKEEVHHISSEWNSRSSNVFDNGDNVYGFLFIG